MSVRTPVRVSVYAMLVLAAVLYLLPIYLLLVTGLKSFGEVNLRTMWELPSGLHFDNFVEALDKLGPNLRNSLMLGVFGSATLPNQAII